MTLMKFFLVLSFLALSACATTPEHQWVDHNNRSELEHLTDDSQCLRVDHYFEMQPIYDVNYHYACMKAKGYSLEVTSQ